MWINFTSENDYSIIYCFKFQDFSPAVLQEVPEAVRIISQEEAQQNQNTIDMTKQLTTSASSSRLSDLQQAQQSSASSKSGALGGCSNRTTIFKSRSTSTVYDGKITNILDIGKVRSLPVTLSELEDSEVYAAAATLDYLAKEDPAYAEKASSFMDYVKSRKKQINSTSQEEGGQPTQQQILEELHVRIFPLQRLFLLSSLSIFSAFLMFITEGRSWISREAKYPTTATNDWKSPVAFTVYGAARPV